MPDFFRVGGEVINLNLVARVDLYTNGRVTIYLNGSPPVVVSESAEAESLRRHFEAYPTVGERTEQ